MYPNHNNHLAAHQLRQAELERAARHEHLIQLVQEHRPKMRHQYLSRLLALIHSLTR